MTTDKLKKYAIPNLPYIMLFWFFSKFGESCRLSPPAVMITSTDLLYKFIGGISNLNIALSNPLPTLNPFDLLIGILGAGSRKHTA